MDHGPIQPEISLFVSRHFTLSLMAFFDRLLANRASGFAETLTFYLSLVHDFRTFFDHLPPLHNDVIVSLKYDVILLLNNTDRIRPTPLLLWLRSSSKISPRGATNFSWFSSFKHIFFMYWYKSLSRRNISMHLLI